MDSLTQSVTKEIRAEMARQQLATGDLAARLGWHPRFLSRRLAGQVPFDLDELAELADVLQISLVDLVWPRSQRKAVSS